MSLLDLPTPAAIAGTKRVHRLGEAAELDEDLPKAMARRQPTARPCPPLPQAAEETIVPKGQYDRSKAKPRKARSTAAVAPAAAEQSKPEKTAMPRAKRFANEAAPMRKKRAAAKPVKRSKRAASPRQPRPSSSAPAFGVYEDGSVVVNGPDCKGRLDPKLAARLVAFIQKLQRK